MANSFLFCYESYFMIPLDDISQAEAFNSTSRYLWDLLDIENRYFEGMVNQIYPTELQLNTMNASNIEAHILDLQLSISNSLVSSKFHDKRDVFNFDIVNFLW